MMSHKVEAVTVNHNTSQYMELMLRSLFAHHPAEMNLSLTVLDNASTDDLSELEVYVKSKGLSIVQTGFTTNTKNNSHGEILGKFVLDQPVAHTIYSWMPMFAFLKIVISSQMVLHFFCVSYVWEPTIHWNEAKAQRRDELLSKYRGQNAS